MNKGLKQIAKEIKNAKRVALFTHISPDYDAFGSTFALYYALKDSGKQVDLFSKDKFTVLQKLLFDESIVKKANCNAENYDLFISCDVPALFRLGAYGHVFQQKENTIVIDHHQNAGLLGKLNYIDNNISSCCEIVLDLLKTINVKITQKIASMLYLGLSSDTTSFVNSNTNIKSFQSAVELLSYGAEIGKLNEILYRTQTKKAIEFKKYLWNNFKIKGDCAYCLISFEKLKELKGKKSDCDAFSSSLISIHGINYSFSIVEQEPNLYSVSMRSKIGYDVRSKAEKLGGGGHLCAAGVKIIAKNINEARDIILSTIKKDT